MSESVHIFQNEESNFKKSKDISYSDVLKLEIISKILSNKSSLSIINHNKSLITLLKSSSIKRIMSIGQLEQGEYIFFSFKKEQKTTKKDLNEETSDEEEEHIVDVNDEGISPNSQIMNKDQKDIILDIKNKNENIFSSDIPLLKDKISNTFSNIENLPKKYINLIILCNKITINLDYLKCFYLTLFFCGLFNLIYLYNVLFDKNRNSLYLDNIYHLFCFPLAIILIITGIYGYKKVKENVYDNDMCLFLTHLSFICPLCSFALSRFCCEDNVTKRIMMNLIINFISSFISFFSIIILKEAVRENNCEKNILHNLN